MTLNYKHFSGPAGSRPLVILHGLFGSLDNWQTLAKAFSEQRTVYTVDQRNHGQSPHSETWTYAAMAEDLAQFIGDHHLDQPDLLGHSMGGKTVMWLATHRPQLLHKAVVVDIAPKDYPPHHDREVKAQQALQLGSFSSRGDADKALAEHIGEPGIRMFLLKNLQRHDQGFAWKHNLPVIADQILNVNKGLPPEARHEGPVLFVRGARSQYIQDDDKELLERHFPNHQLETVADAGHWIHAEKPAELQGLVERFLQD